MLEFRRVEMIFQGGLLQKKKVYALRGITLGLEEGEIFGLMGESGSGKSTLGKLALGLLTPTAGEICWGGVCWKRGRPMPLKARLAIQGIFQNPYGAFNPRHRIGYALAEPLRRHRHYRTKKEENSAVEEMLSRLNQEPDCLQKYPTQLSGGQLQRLALARLLLMRPRFIVADEPTTMLDLTIQAQVIHLLRKIHRETGAGFLLISHDLDIIAALAGRVGVMYAGELVETAPREKLLSAPRHPYTRLFLAAAAEKPLPVDKGADELERAHGCLYAAGCELVRPECLRLRPALGCVDGDHFVACHLA